MASRCNLKLGYRMVRGGKKGGIPQLPPRLLVNVDGRGHMIMNVAAIYRYPVKGLSPDPLRRADLLANQTIAFDRAWAIENGPGRFLPHAPTHLPKVSFLMLMRNERLAALETRFDEAEQTLAIQRGGRVVARGDLTTSAGRAIIEQFFAAYMQDDLRGPPRVVSAAGHSFSDMAAKCLHIVNLASVLDLERLLGRPVSHLRFRPNVVIIGAPPWAEFNWVGKDIVVGGANLSVFARTDRCAATNVDPQTGKRDLDIPAALARAFGHTDFGIYARVTADGALAVGDRLAVMPNERQQPA